MLPGLRFLFVAILLSLSMLIFGLGAASLLRSAHEEFASLPNRRVQPEPVFAQPVETTRPTLALLRVDMPREQPAPNAATPPEPPAPVAAEPETSAEPDKVAALDTAAPSEEKPKPADKPADLSADQPAEPAAETPAPTETPARADIAVPPPEIQAAATPQPSPLAAIKAVVTASEPAATPADDGARAAAMKIATLGGPEVIVDPKAASKAPQVTAGKSAQPRHRTKRRRIVRSRIVAPKPVTLGFFDPLPVPDRPTRQN
jgi:hypothetical protein